MYIETVGRTDGLVASYIVLDSSDCFEEYGVRAADPADWHEIRDALEAIGIPSIALEMQEYKLAGPEQIRTRVEALVEMIGKGRAA